MTNEKLRASLNSMSENGHLSCVRAITLSGELSVSPEETGAMMNVLKIKIERCQLGLFGHGERNKILDTKDEVSESLIEAITNALIDGEMHCKRAWELADTFKIKRIDVANACEKLNIKISHCQLGAF